MATTFDSFFQSAGDAFIDSGFDARTGGVGDLLVIGTFTTDSSSSGTNYNGIAATDLSTWFDFGVTSKTGLFQCAAVHGGNLWVGGTITDINGTTYKRIAMWDGSAWSVPIGGGFDNGNVSDLRSHGGVLYAVGSFSAVDGGTTARKIAKLNETTEKWEEVDTGFGTGNPHEMTVYNGQLHVVGEFTGKGTGGTAYPQGVVSLSGNTLSNVGTGAFDTFTGKFYIEAIGTRLYVGGASALDMDGTTYFGLVQWDGSTWSALASGIVDKAHGLGQFQGDLTFGEGLFGSNSGLGRWNGSSFSGFGIGFDSFATDSLEHKGFLTTIGDFFFLSDFATAMDHAAYWNEDTSTWTKMATGFSGAPVMYQLREIPKSLSPVA